ncbi:unnamed protein product [Lepidochelys kempii]
METDPLRKKGKHSDLNFNQCILINMDSGSDTFSEDIHLSPENSNSLLKDSAETSEPVLDLPVFFTTERNASTAVNEGVVNNIVKVAGYLEDDLINITFEACNLKETGLDCKRNMHKNTNILFTIGADSVGALGLEHPRGKIACFIMQQPLENLKYVSNELEDIKCKTINLCEENHVVCECCRRLEKKVESFTSKLTLLEENSKAHEDKKAAVYEVLSVEDAWEYLQDFLQEIKSQNSAFLALTDEIVSNSASHSILKANKI